MVPIHVPPLRERREDIPLLVAHFAAVLTEREGVPPRTIAPGAVERLSELDWPGNVRELRNTIERLLILASGAEVAADDVERLVGSAGVARRDGGGALGPVLQCRTFEEFKHAAERAFLLAKLREYDWNVSETARGARDAAIEPLQEDRAVRAEPRERGLTAAPHQPRSRRGRTRLVEGTGQDRQATGIDARRGAGTAGARPRRRAARPGAASAPAGGAALGDRPARKGGKPARETAGFGVYARLTLSVVLGVAIVLWPYESRCGFGLAAYLAAVGVVAVSGGWSAVWTWRHRAARAHVLSLLILLWGLVLGAMEVLPRIGYAKADLQHPAGWVCK